MDEAIKIINVSKKIGKKTIINNFSFDIKKGEVFGLLGPNGAGKTTLIKMIVGLISITSGDILINNKSIKKDFKDAISNIGALVEYPALYPNLSGYRNLKIFSNMYSNLTKNDITHAIDIVDLGDAINTKVKQYSLGMKQRLGISIALLNKPSILILDEPTNGLDPQGILDLRRYLKSLAKDQDVCVVVSSHMLTEMELLCDRFAIINKGDLSKVTSKSDNKSTNKELEYIFELDNSLNSFNLLKDNYNIKLKDNNLIVISSKNNVPDIVNLLVSNNIKIYSITESQSSLEEYYFDVINGRSN